MSENACMGILYHDKISKNFNSDDTVIPVIHVRIKWSPRTEQAPADRADDVYAGGEGREGGGDYAACRARVRPLFTPNPSPL